MKGVVSYFAKMEAIMQYLRDFNIVTVTLRLVLAFLFGGIIGMDRERKGRPAGMRTHILVCLGASMTTMSGFSSYIRLELNRILCVFPHR